MIFAILTGLQNQRYDPSWIADHIAGVVGVGLFVVGAIVDIWLKFSKKTSISEFVWLVCSKHPTLYSLGFIVTAGVMYLVRDQWALVGLAAYIGGHLFSGLSPSPKDDPQGTIDDLVAANKLDQISPGMYKANF